MGLPSIPNSKLNDLLSGKKTLIMGILNVTPDSFSDGGKFYNLELAVNHALEMATAGADIIDIGGQSTRPGAEEISLSDEFDRVIPVIRKLRQNNFPLPISIDTTKAAVAKQAISDGACVVNDISALEDDPDMLDVIAITGAHVVLMHRQGKSATMQQNPVYSDVVREIKEYLSGRINICLERGVDKSRIIIDPGIGFGKTLEHNLSILRGLTELVALGYPVMLGTSRKALLGQIMDLPSEERQEGTIATCVWGRMQGVKIMRVHDVRSVHRTMQVTDRIIAEY